MATPLFKNRQFEEIPGDFIIFKIDSTAQRYAPTNRAHIHGFSNLIPCIDWQSGLSKFKGQDGEDASFHLVKFHFHIHRLKIEFPEDCLMNMFMATLEEKAR